MRGEDVDYSVDDVQFLHRLFQPKSTQLHGKDFLQSFIYRHNQSVAYGLKIKKNTPKKHSITEKSCGRAERITTPSRHHQRLQCHRVDGVE